MLAWKTAAIRAYLVCVCRCLQPPGAYSSKAAGGGARGWGGGVGPVGGRLGSVSGVWSRGGLRLPYHTPQKVRTQVWSEWKENFTTKLPRTTLGTGHGKRILPALRTGLARLKSPCVPQGVVCFLSFFLARTGTNTGEREKHRGNTTRKENFTEREFCRRTPQALGCRYLPSSEIPVWWRRAVLHPSLPLRFLSFFSNTKQL